MSWSMMWLNIWGGGGNFNKNFYIGEQKLSWLVAEPLA